MRKEEQKKIDESEPLTEEEITEKEDLLTQVRVGVGPRDDLDSLVT